MSERVIDTLIDVCVGPTHYTTDGSGAERPQGPEKAPSHTDGARKHHIPVLINGPQILELCTCQTPQVKPE